MSGNKRDEERDEREKKHMGREKNSSLLPPPPPPPGPPLGGLDRGASRFTSSVSRLSESGRITQRTCDPRSDSDSSACAGLPLGTSLTFFRCVFIAPSTPTTVPWTTEPFLSSTWTVSWTSLERKLFWFFERGKRGEEERGREREREVRGEEVENGASDRRGGGGAASRRRNAL